ncbi:MAG TPA: hypothetical protein VL989_01015 [Candidatus Sulfotelmatobacter sp.]|nr:hypothetical protein [Candidatus Sulfotelmatobacter sp.]
MANDKDTIYIDVDDEITGIIDKVKASKSKVVALVLPKRATVFQSIVNMKLLKKSVEGSSKSLVLITAEAGLLPLAGAAGIHVAKTLTSKPEIPTPPEELAEEETGEETAETLPPEEPVDASKPVGELAGDKPVAAAAAGAAAGAAAADKKGDMETVALDNTALDESAGDKAKEDKTKGKTKKAKGEKDKDLKVPNFERFRKYMLIGLAGVVALVILYLLFGTNLGDATIDVYTNGSNVNSSVDLNLSTSATSVDTNSGTIPAKLASQQKTSSATVGTTGQTNNGNKASGSVSITAAYCNVPPPSGTPASLPAGTGLSSNGLTFITQQVTTFSSSGNSHGGCSYYPATGNTPIIAQSGGTSYNNANSFSLSGYDISVAQTIMGGTDNIVQTVNQNDINNAKSKISTNNNSGVKTELENELQGEGYYPIDDTFAQNAPSESYSAQVGQVANNVTVTESINYTMFGVPKNDLETLIASSVDNQINTSQQMIIDYGIDHASYSVNSQNSSAAQITMNTVVFVGPQLNVNKIKAQAAGQKAGAVKAVISTNPNVTNVTVHIKPFWYSTVPKNPSRITVHIQKPASSSSS